MKEFNWVKGKEVKTYQDILEAVDGFILEDDCGKVAVSQSALLNKTERSSMGILTDYINQGGKAYARIKEYRKPIFDKETDDELETILYDFATDWEQTDYGDEDCVEKVLKELKELFNIVSEKVRKETAEKILKYLDRHLGNGKLIGNVLRDCAKHFGVEIKE